MRRFSAEYLEATREGMWADSREPLATLDLSARESILDVGAGTGALTAVLREEAPGRTVALDADLELLSGVAPPRVGGDATRLPFADDSFDLVVCQALLVNVTDPAAAVRELARVAADAVAVIEPDNGDVTIESTVDGEAELARYARSLYIEGVRTDPTLGDVPDLFEQAGLGDVSVSRYDHVKTTDPPYTERDLESARRKVTGEGIASDRAEILAGDVTAGEFDDLESEWRAVGRAVVDEMQAGTYRHRETVPFFVTVGSVGPRPLSKVIASDSTVDNGRQQSDDTGGP